MLPEGTRVIRVMPNLPTVVQSAACVFARGSHADNEDADLVTEMLNCVGLVEEMPEHLMDAVTGLSGNGPAYVSCLTSVLRDARNLLNEKINSDRDFLLFYINNLIMNKSLK